MPGIIEGRRWIEQRLRHLQQMLDNDPTDETRRAIESELEQLREQAGRARRRWWTWVWPRHRTDL